MGCLEQIISKAKALNKTIVLPEATDLRILKAANVITKEKIAVPILVGNKYEIEKKALEYNIDISDVKIIDPLGSCEYENYVKVLYELRKEKGLTLDMAKELVKDPVYFGVLMVKMGAADGLVSGAIHTTADTLRPALQIIKGREKVVSSFILMDITTSKYAGTYVFSDCGLIPNPTAEQLAIIASQSASSYKLLAQEEPKVALLSYSSHGSAKSECTEKVIQAKNILDQGEQLFKYDGEIQLDAAIDPVVAQHKVNGSPIAGHANVLIFPNLDSGNIGYKLVERFAEAQAIGPITQGLNKPINDLSRGCKAEDVVMAVAVTAIQAENI